MSARNTRAISKALNRVPAIFKSSGFFIGTLMALDLYAAVAIPLDLFGPPPADDPSHFTGPPKNAQAALEALETAAPANIGSFEEPNGIAGDRDETRVENVLPPPDWEKWARKDVYRIGEDSESQQVVEMAVHFREFAGTYMEHCHNTQHEDNSMLLRWDIEHPGQVQLMPTPLPSWDGVKYVDSAALPTFRTGDGTGQASR